MIFNISDNQFKRIMCNPNFNLPVRWEGRNFERAISDLLDEYINELLLFGEDKDPDNEYFMNIEVDTDKICLISDLLKRCIREYHQGFPSNAFRTMKRIMNVLIERPLKVYQKSGSLEPLETDRLYLFRLRGISDTAKHTKKDLFHVPSSARSMISTCRYSIAGYPSLYLTTSIELGKEEIGRTNNNLLVSRFKLIRSQQELNIRVLELAVRPQDFYNESREYNNANMLTKDLRDINLRNKDFRASYLLWYPLIAACSFIRANKNSPFSSEYIIPQLLMQWIRKQVGGNELMGIRYFSCASIRASELGFDYVFPVNNTKYEEGYCSVLRDSFSLTNPVYLGDYDSIGQCERYLISCNDLDKI